MNRNISRTGDTALLRAIASSTLGTLIATASGSTLVGKAAGGDFAIAYTSAVTLTASGLPAEITTLDSDDILAIIQYDSSGNFQHIFTRDTNTMTVAANVITVHGAAFDATDSFVVYTNYPAAGGASAGAASASSSIEPDVKIGTQQGTVTFTSSSTLTLGGSYPAITNDAQILYIKVIPAAAEGATVYINGDGIHKITHSGGVISIVGATPFVTGDQYEIGISTVPTGHDVANDAIKTEELTPAKTNYTNSETLVSEVDQATATTNRYIFDVSDSGYRFWSLHYKVFADTADDDTTITLWGTNNDAADDTADTDWIDITNDLIGAATLNVVNTTVEDFILYDVPCPFTRVMVKIVYTYTGGGAVNSSTDMYLVRMN